MYNLPSYQDCIEICNYNSVFYENIKYIDEYKISIFNYLLASPKDFVLPYTQSNIDAYELRGLAFVHNDIGTPKRFLALRKFFNLNQCDGYMYDQIKDKEIIRIQTKLDGSMISCIQLPNGKILAKSKQSFETSQAQFAQKKIDSDEDGITKFISVCFSNDLSPIFEYISPFNRIVIGYDKSRLLLLQLRDQNSGLYCNIYDHPLVKQYNIACAYQQPSYDIDYYIESAKTFSEMEGWVFTYSDGQMIKIKTDWYKERHHLLDNSISREDYIISFILDDKLDDIISIFAVDDPIRLYAQYVFEKLTSHVRDTVHKILDFTNEFYDGNRKTFVEKFKDHEYFSYMMSSISYIENTNLELNYDIILNFVKKDILKKTYKLNQARKFLDKIGINYERIHTIRNL